MNILAIGAHWDDIEIGCGLTLNKLSKKKHKIYGIVICTSQYGKNENEGMSEKTAKNSGLKSFDMMGIKYIHTPKQQNSQFTYNKKIMQILEDISIDKKIDTVFTHWFGDTHTDHKAVWDVSKTAFRNIKNFLMFRTNRYNDNVHFFNPNYFSTFTKKEYEFKTKLIKNYKIEWKKRKVRWNREIFESEKVWGYTTHSDFAEAFQINKMVDWL